jgi:cobalt-precorrin 5A hydrolase
MSATIAIGVGCRLGCAADAIETLVRQALDQAPAGERLGIFTIDDKASEPGLLEAARRLGLALVPLSRDALREQAPFVQTRSERTERRFGVPAVAEAAALAGLSRGAVLIGPRKVSHGVTCAIAVLRP